MLRTFLVYFLAAKPIIKMLMTVSFIILITPADRQSRRLIVFSPSVHATTRARAGEQIALHYWRVRIPFWKTVLRRSYVQTGRSAIIAKTYLKRKLGWSEFKTSLPRRFYRNIYTWFLGNNIQYIYIILPVVPDLWHFTSMVNKNATPHIGGATGCAGCQQPFFIYLRVPLYQQRLNQRYTLAVSPLDPTLCIYYSS